MEKQTLENRFKIVEELAGQGGFGFVSKATDLELERDVAIKTLDPLFKSIDSTDIERFKREAKTLAALSHPNIPSIYDVEFEPDKKEFRLIYAWIEGITLREYLTKVGILSLDDVKKYFGNICSALGHSHQKDIIHRDIKPSNLIITTTKESCYLVDFGISLTSKDIERLTNGKSAVGTPGYMSPEQERNEELDSSSDIFSLGVILYESLCGMRPTVGEYKPLSTINEAIPTSIDNLIRDCITEKDKRIKTSDEFYSRLTSALRPSANLGVTFAQGAISDIIASLDGLNSISFNNLPSGQKTLLLIKLKTLISTNEYRMRNPTASFLHSILKLSERMAENDFRFISSKSLNYGFDIQYGETWTGNPSLRQELGRLAIIAEHNQHKFLTDELLKYLAEKGLDKKSDWFLSDFKTIIQNLLANDQCDDETANKLGETLEKVLTEIYKD
jgi:serine/threonine-protein kinase